MKALPPIPVPLSTRWRTFQTRVLPICWTVGAGVAAAWLWQQTASSGNFAGVVEGNRSMVSSPMPAELRSLLVRPYQFVAEGDPVAIVLPVDHRGQLDLLQTELQLARLALEPTVPEQNALSFERLRFELLRIKSEVATAKVDLQRAENQVRRQQPLFEEKLVSEDLYDLSSKTRDSVLAEVREKSNAVMQMERRLEELRPLGEPRFGTIGARTLASFSELTARHQSAVSNLGPITLTAPIAGMVNFIQRQPGEHVLEGEPLVTISSPRSDRVVGYLRQPYSGPPRIGMQALLTTREWKRRRFLGTVSQVGAQLEYITNSLAMVRPGSLVDSGLPVVIELPPDNQLRPGEIVDIEIRELATFADPPKVNTETARPFAAHRVAPSDPP